jgi:hypothetical protein
MSVFSVMNCHCLQNKRATLISEFVLILASVLLLKGDLGDLGTLVSTFVDGEPQNSCVVMMQMNPMADDKASLDRIEPHMVSTS